VTGVGIVVVDITQREEAEHLRLAVMDTMMEGLCVLDGDGRLVFMNAEASELLGWSEEELRGRNMHEAVHFQHADGSAFPAEECELVKVRTEGRPLRMSRDAFTRKDGTIFPVAYSAAPLKIGSVGPGAVVVFRDVSAEVDKEEQVKRELDRLAWVGRIRDALDEDRLTLYSQPIVPLGGGEPSQELLLRMIGSNGEIVSPGSFLPVAERYGLVGEIDQWVIRKAIRIAAAGQQVEANLSAESIGNLDLLPVIAQELHDTGADPAKVVFEITETALMGSLEAGEAFAIGLSSLGCKIALDDFGTGFGSFTYLKKLPIDYLKIDADFVTELVANQANQHLVKAIVGLARDFGYETIAEGVEDAETLALLRGYGVDFAEGRHLGRPVPIDESFS
jgi:PAS domain S-box-containing protein